jgi:hypothetical protein
MKTKIIRVRRNTVDWETKYEQAVDQFNAEHRVFFNLAPTITDNEIIVQLLYADGINKLPPLGGR